MPGLRPSRPWCSGRRFRPRGRAGGAQVNYLFRWNIRRGDPDSYRVLLLFGCHLLEKDIADRIAEWVESGGTLIGDFDSGRFDESFRERFWLEGVFGARPAAEPMKRRPRRIEFKQKGQPPIMVGIHPETPSGDFCELETTVPKTQVLARFPDRGPAITAHRYGKGTAILVGLRMGLEEKRRGSNPGIEDLLGALIRSHYTPPAQSDKRDIEIGVWDGGAAKYLVVVRHIPPPPPTTTTDREVVALARPGPLLADRHVSRVA